MVGHTQNFLQDWQGHLLVDDYGGYNPLFSSASSCTELGCWTDARRKCFELHQANNSSMAMEALQRIGMLYAIEAEGKHLTIEDRQQLRAEKSLPTLNALHDWLIQTRSQTANGGGSAKALDYTLKRWPSLIRYAQSGHLPIDNNPVENAIRPIALGKKIGYLPAQSVPANAQPLSKLCSVPLNLMDWTHLNSSKIRSLNFPPGLNRPYRSIVTPNTGVH
ncbi:Transposase IS66 family protein [Nitrosomonas sp. Nm34]|nr:Transposase IS66 family protein [Nitrosomonas sp. Nm34]